MTEMAQCSQPVTMLLAGHPQERCCIRGLVLVPVAGRSGTQQRLLPGQPWWMEAHVLSPCTTSIPATMATLIMDLLAVTRMAGKRGWLPTGHLIGLITELLLCWRRLVMGICMGHSIFTSFPPLESATSTFLPHMSFSPIFPSCFFPVPWLSSQTIVHRPYISVQLHVWPFPLPRKMHECGMIEVLPTGNIFLHLYLSELVQNGLDAIVVHF